MSMDYRKYVPEITAHEPRAFLIHALCLGLRHGVNHQPDSQRETPTKRIALAEVHKLCVVVFDFLEYDILLLCQRSGQFLLMTNHQLCGNVVLTSTHDFIFVRSYVAVVEIFECGQCCHLPFQAQQDTTEKEKVQRKRQKKNIFVFLPPY